MSELAKLAAKIKPVRHRRSKLDPYLVDLPKLRKQGYTLKQCVDLLEQLNVYVTIQTIHNFLKKHEGNKK